MATFADSLATREAIRSADTLKDGPVDGSLLPLMRINGKLYVVPNTLHFYYPAVANRPTKPRTDGGRSAGASNE